MTSRKGKARERQLARDKYERQLARRAAGARRRRQVKAGAGILALLLAGLAVAWFLGAFDGLLKDDKDSKPKDEPSASATETPSGEESKSGDGKSEDEKSSEEPSDEAGSSEADK